jgi:UDP-glucose 4-epimerase
LEKTWLITGGNGFIGTNVRDILSEQYPEHKVVVVDTKNPNREFVDSSKWVNINVANWKAMCRTFDKYKPNYVLHLAAETRVRESMKTPKICIEKNVVGTLNCLELARRHECELAVLASSCGVCGEQLGFGAVDEQTSSKPISPYATSKVCTEQVGSCYEKLGLKVCNLRLANVYGPWSDHKESVVSLFVKGFLNDSVLKINGNGSQTRNFIYAKDAAMAIVKCVNKGASGTYCIASDKSMSINDLVSVICEVCQGDAKIEFGENVDGEIVDININNAKARRELMFQCEYSIVDGVAETVDWFRQLKSGAL